MSLVREHELHKRRKSRNVGLGLVLGAFICIVFGLTVAKVQRGDFDLRAGQNSTLIDMDGNPVAVDETGRANSGN
jgi:hypothetical protein